MKYLLCDLLRDVIDAAKETGIWQLLTLREQGELVDHFLHEYRSMMEEAEAAGGELPQFGLNEAA